MDKSCRDMEITIIFSIVVNSPLSRRDREPPFPPISMLETIKHQRNVLQHCLGGRGLTIEEKVVFIQMKSIIISLKASTLLSTIVGPLCPNIPTSLHYEVGAPNFCNILRKSAPHSRPYAISSRPHEILD